MMKRLKKLGDRFSGDNGDPEVRQRAKGRAWFYYRSSGTTELSGALVVVVSIILFGSGAVAAIVVLWRLIWGG